MSQHINKQYNENNTKNKFYQTKTISEKDVTKLMQSKSTKDVTHTLCLNKLIESSETQEIIKFIIIERPSIQVLNNGIFYLIQKYQKGNSKFYEILNILLQYGASINLQLNLNQQNQNKKLENISLLMFAIKENDIDLVKLILEHHPDINQKDCIGRTAIIYSLIYNNHDSPEIVKLLIQNKANINYFLNIEMNENIFETHSVFTLACFQNLTRITKVLLENYVDVTFRTKPNGDTGLHIAVKYGSPNLLNLLLSYNRTFSEIKNNQGKRAVELLKENDTEKTNIFKKYYNMMNNMNRLNNQNLQQQNNNNNVDNNNMNMYNNNLNYQQYNQMIQNQMHMGNNQIQNQQNMFNYNNNNQDHNEKNNFKKNNSGALYQSPNNNNILDAINNKDSESSENLSDEEDDEKDNEINIKLNNNDVNNNSNNENISNTKSPEKVNNFANMSNINNNTQEFENINCINNDKQKMLKQKLFNKILNKNNVNYNLEIPLCLKKNVYSLKNNIKNNKNSELLNNFVEKDNECPVLDLNISSKNLELELKINELSNLLQEKSQKFSIFENEFRLLNRQIEEKKKLLKEKNNDLDYLQTLSSQNEMKITDLENTKKQLMDQIPQDKILHKSNKNIPQKEYLVLKFQPPELTESFTTKILQKDLIDYQNYISHQVSKKKPIIEKIITKIQNLVNEIDPNYIVKIFGSYANGLCVTWSNLDLVLVNKTQYSLDDFSLNNNNNIMHDNDINNQNLLMNNDNVSFSYSESIQSTAPSINNNINEFFYRFYLEIQNQQQWIKQHRTNENVYGKILRLTTTEEYGKMTVDISVQNDKHYGIKCVELVKSYIKEYDVLKPMTIALKTILKNANLNNSYTGGLSSYGLILMIVSYIQNKRDSFYAEDETNLIGNTFYGFLLHYGIKFDFNKYAIITYKINEINAALSDKETNLNIGQNAHELMIVDPLNNKNNVAKTNYQFMNLKMAFMIAFMVTKEDCECGCHYGKAAYENLLCSTEHSYLKRMLNAVKRFTETGK